MSRDQKPGKVKIYSGGQAPAHPLRRADDIIPADMAEAMEVEPTTGPSLLMAMLFLVGCVAGGSAFVILPTL